MFLKAGEGSGTEFRKQVNDVISVDQIQKAGTKSIEKNDHFLEIRSKI